MKTKLDYASLTTRDYRKRVKLLEGIKDDLRRMLADSMTRDGARINAARELREIDAELQSAAVARTSRKDDKGKKLERENTKLKLELEEARTRVNQLEAALSAEALRHDSA